MAAFISKVCDGEKCGMCWRDERTLAPATHKVTEEIMSDDPHPGRHELIQYVCERHFNRIFGNFK